MNSEPLPMVSLASFSLPAQIGFLTCPDCIQIGFRKSGPPNSHEKQFLQIRSKPHGEVVWNAIHIWFLQICLWSRCSARSIRISECHLCHFMDTWRLNGESWWTRRSVKPPQSLVNVTYRMSQGLHAPNSHSFVLCFVFPVVTLPRFKAAHQRMYWRRHHYHKNRCRYVGTEQWCLDAINPIWSPAN